MIQLTSRDEVNAYVTSKVGSIGLVPTMGALHQGHESLIKMSQSMCDHTIVSIFVNPTQFGPSEDFDRYPRDLEQDRALCLRLGVSALLVPTTADVYPDGENAHYQPHPEIADVMCGKSRPHFFYGVCNCLLYTSDAADE